MGLKRFYVENMHMLLYEAEYLVVTKLYYAQVSYFFFNGREKI